MLVKGTPDVSHWKISLCFRIKRWGVSVMSKRRLSGNTMRRVLSSLKIIYKPFGHRTLRHISYQRAPYPYVSQCVKDQKHTGAFSVLNDKFAVAKIHTRKYFGRHTACPVPITWIRRAHCCHPYKWRGYSYVCFHIYTWVADKPRIIRAVPL